MPPECHCNATVQWHYSGILPGCWCNKDRLSNVYSISEAAYSYKDQKTKAWQSYGFDGFFSYKLKIDQGNGRRSHYYQCQKS
ncbi:hypothetical protein SAMN05660816_03214 [Niastella yeongjuensis]|nr:hypothetical protein SAMN05660816_03214 [Niastella yeongjuensis]